MTSDTDADTTKEELQAQAEFLGLSKSGTKADIQTRIDNAMAGIVDKARQVSTDDYTVGTWKGIPNYECNSCGFASLKKRTTILHIASVHAN